MYAILRELLSDKKGDVVFSCFGIWHLCWLAAALAVAVITVLYSKNRDKESQRRACSRCIALAFGLYMADFFLMPFAYGEMDVEKLPFHACTAMCVMCFWSRHTGFWGRFRLQFAALGFLSNLVYLIYPAGLMWYQVHPLSYRVVQTLLFHGVMTMYGLLTLLFDSEEFEWRRCRKDLAVVAAMTLWALLGNALYTGEVYDFNWFFVTRDPFYILPEHIAPYIMPLLNTALFFGVEMLVYAVILRIKTIKTSK